MKAGAYYGTTAGVARVCREEGSATTRTATQVRSRGCVGGYGMRVSVSERFFTGKRVGSGDKPSTTANAVAIAPTTRRKVENRSILLPPGRRDGATFVAPSGDGPFAC